MEVVPVCAKFEEELAALEPDEAKAFLDDIGAAESGLQRVIRTGYKLLDYCTFFTTGTDETRAFSAALSLYRLGFASSMYQSQSVPQMKS